MKASEFFVRKQPPKQGSCFVLMPFQEGLTAVYEHGIKPLVESMGMQCKRADEIYSAQNILGDIWDSIQSSELIIADLTGKNPNVMYELGLCHVLWKRVILLSQSKDDVPFDLRAWRVIWYDFTFAGAARLKEELGRAIDALKLEESIEAQVVPLEPATDSSQPSPAPEDQWVVGTITHWKPDRNFGFINTADEDFWFNQDYLFTQSMIPDEGSTVIFVPISPLPNAKNRRASRIFVENCTLQGKINRTLRGKACAFATVQGQNGQSHSIFLETGEDNQFMLDEYVEFTTGHNRTGPKGTNVKLLNESDA